MLENLLSRSSFIFLFAWFKSIVPFLFWTDYIYDPFVSDKPIPQSEYTQILKDKNPNGVSWRIKGETDSPDIPELKKGGF